ACASLLQLQFPGAGRCEPYTSGWAFGPKSALRLIAAGGGPPDSAYRAGIEIQLEPGAFTYWRMPGSAGVPPVFDWSAAQNLAAVAPDWPAPRRLEEEGVSVIGYTGDNLVLPLRITAVDSKKPVELVLSLNYAACKTICVPEKGEAALTLLPGMPEGLYSALIEAARREVPKRVEPAVLGLDRPNAAMLALGSADPSLALAVNLGAGEHVLDIFVEGPENWLFGAPKTVANGGSGDVRLPLLDHPKWVDRAADIPFTVTILTDMRALETVIGARTAS
ncbi:MAG TPA: protein-disulfide reductase DsbD domain-containing protein, partial [Beijerinckiaceae bacterium]|nr:protein-disulfide reductase DsbD domain-containing protein [Beijerinckiaceae bacterium]